MLFCSTTRYSPFMMYFYLQNLLIINSHCSTYHNELLFERGIVIDWLIFRFLIYSNVILHDTL